MAKNAHRKATSEAQKNSKPSSRADKDKLSQSAVKDQNAAKELKKPSAESSKREILYQVKTKRDSDVIKAYITFIYRVMHPGVTGRLIFFGILIALPAIIAQQLWLKAACVTVGCLLILLGFFRQYISLAITKKNDEAYKNGTVFTYDFTLNDAAFYSDHEMTSSISKYKEIISFYYDDDYYYLGIRNRDFFILPKSKFTIGDPDEFADFIYKRCKKTCKWIPNKFSDRMKLARAARALNSESGNK